MSACERIRPCLFRVAEGEASPAEAIEVARHVPTCTACRILLAREQRLARMLADELEDLPVGEEFVVSVMATLPEGPPPDTTRGRTRRRAVRGIKLAGLAGMAAAGLFRTAPDWSLHWATRGIALPSLGPADASGPQELLLGAARLGQLAIEACAALGPALPASPAAGLVALGTLAAIGAIAVAGGSTLLAIAAGCLLQTDRG